MGDICAVLKETREQHICRCLERGAHAEGAAGAKTLGWKLFGSNWEPSVAGAQRASVRMVENKVPEKTGYSVPGEIWLDH